MPPKNPPHPRRLPPTIIDVAKLAGVSKSTVSRVLRDEPRVSPGSREKVLAAAAELRYTPDSTAQRMRAKPDPSIGLVVSTVDSPIFAKLNRDLHEKLREKGYHVVQEMILDPTEAAVRSQIENIIGFHVQGLIIAAGVITDEMLRDYAERLPLVFVGPPAPGLGVHNIAYDELHHGRMIVDHLHALGHEKALVQVLPRRASRGTWNRNNGVRERATELGIRLREVDVSAPVDLAAMVHAALRENETAIICAYDQWLFRTWRAVRALGLDAPADISLTGSDGVTDGIDLLGITTIRHPVAQLAARAADLVVELVEQPGGAQREPVNELIRGDLMLGSSGPPSQRK